MFLEGILAFLIFLSYMKKLSLSLVVIALASSCATNPVVLANQIDGNDEERTKICRFEKVLGTRIPEKFCYTKEELEKIEEESRKTLEKQQRTGERRRTQETLGNLNPE